MKSLRWMLDTAIVMSLMTSLVMSLGCDQSDTQPETGTKTNAKQAPATKVEPGPTATDELPKPESHVNDEAVVACKEAATNARAKPASRDKILREGCASMLQQDACREALSGDHATFWKTCAEVYCPVLKEGERTSVVCELDIPPAERAANLPVRAAFMTDIMLLERDIAPMPVSFHEQLREALEADPANRQAAMKGLIGTTMKSDDITAQQREVWSLGMMLSIVEPVSPPLNIGSVGQ